MNIAIGAKHYGSTIKNIINGTVKVSQKMSNSKILEQIALGLFFTYKPLLKYCHIKTNPFENIKIDSCKLKASEMGFNQNQSYLFSKYVDSECFKNPILGTN
jgi:hypothetical protein